MVTHIILILAVVMAGHLPNITKEMEVTSIDECFTQAKKFVEQPKPDIKDAIGLGASCEVQSGDDL